MNKIPGVSYPIDQSAKNQLCKLPHLSGRFSLPDSDRSDLEIVRLLGNTHYEHIQDLLEYLDGSVLVAGPLVDEILKQTDPMEFGGKLSELYMYCHIARHMPGYIALPSGQRSNKRPDMTVNADGLDVAIEVYGPMNLFGFQLVETYAIRILKYLEIDRGYDLRLKIEPDAEYDPFYAYQFETEKEIRPWLCEFSEAAAGWLLNPSPPRVFKKKGPNASNWGLSVEIEELHEDRSRRTISQSTASRSDDSRLHFEVGTAETTANGWWGRSVKKKMAERQAGFAPKDDLLRLLVIDFARLDTSFPDFICWSGIAERIDACVRLLASKMDGPLPYDVVLPARLGPSCCFGTPVWLGEGDVRFRERFFALASLTTPCESPRVDAVDWASILTE